MPHVQSAHSRMIAAYISLVMRVWMSTRGTWEIGRDLMSSSRQGTNLPVTNLTPKRVAV